MFTNISAFNTWNKEEIQECVSNMRSLTVNQRQFLECMSLLIQSLQENGQSNEVPALLLLLSQEEKEELERMAS